MNQSLNPRISLLSIILIFILIAISIGAVGYYYAGKESAQSKQSVAERLTVIAEMKVGQIASWNKERLANAEVAQDIIFPQLLEKYLQNPGDKENERAMLTGFERFRQAYGYTDIVFVDTQDNVRCWVGSHKADIETKRLESLHHLINKTDPVMLPLYRTGEGVVVLDIAIPFRSGITGEALGVALLRIDPYSFLYPMIQSWPTPSMSAETLIVQREGNDVVFLNTLRHQQNEPLSLRLPINSPELIAAYAAQGRQEIIEGVDYRGTRVFARTLAVPGTEWIMIAKVDISEVLAPLRKQAGFILGLSGVLICFVAACVVAIINSRGKQALRDSEQRFRSLFDQAAVGIAQVGLDGRWLRVNQRLCDIVGYSHNELLKLTFQAVTHPEDLNRDIAKVQQLMVGEISTYSVEKRYVRKDSSLVWVNLTVGVVRNSLGKPDYFVSVVQDISNRRQAEKELIELSGSLKRSNQDLEQFAFVASHDLQEPLRMISSYTQLLEQHYQGQLDEKAKTYMAYVVDGAMRMQRLINDLLAYSRVHSQDITFETISMSTILGETLRNLSALIEETQTIITNDDLPLVRANSTQILQLLQNLISNAIKFRRPHSPHIHVSVCDQGDMWLFSVQDNGIGIDVKYAERIFGLFQRLHTRQEYPGTGIGLALCRRIVEGHGGKIWVESTVGGGSTFYFTLHK